MFHCLVIKVLCLPSCDSSFSLSQSFLFVKNFFKFFSKLFNDFCDSLLISNSFTLSHSFLNVKYFFQVFSRHFLMSVYRSQATCLLYHMFVSLSTIIFVFFKTF